MEECSNDCMKYIVYSNKRTTSNGPEANGSKKVRFLSSFSTTTTSRATIATEMQLHTICACMLQHTRYAYSLRDFFSFFSLSLSLFSCFSIGAAAAIDQFGPTSWLRVKFRWRKKPWKQIQYLLHRNVSVHVSKVKAPNKYPAAAVYMPFVCVGCTKKKTLKLTRISFTDACQRDSFVVRCRSFPLLHSQTTVARTNFLIFFRSLVWCIRSML